MSNNTMRSKVGAAVKAAVTDNAAAMRTAWLDAATMFQKAESRQTIVQTERKGAYVLVIEAGILAGSLEPFETVANQVFAEIRSNQGGLAKRIGCKLGKGRKGQTPGYLIPGALMVAKSVIVAAFQSGVALTETEDGETRPRSFNAVRDDVKEAAEAARVAGLTGRDRSIYLVRVMANTVADNAEAFTNDEMTIALESLERLVKLASGAAKRAEAEESKGAELAGNTAESGRKAA